MTKEDIIRKLTSRKFWVAVSAFVSLILVAVGFNENEAAQVTAIIMAGASVLAYILGEGLVDASRPIIEPIYDEESVDDECDN